jgi:hypothetical protein
LSSSRLPGKPIDYNGTVAKAYFNTLNNTVDQTSLVGTADEVEITAGVVSLADNLIIPGHEAVKIPIGTTAERPTGTDGMIRYNSSNEEYELYSSGWQTISQTYTANLGSTVVRHNDSLAIVGGTGCSTVITGNVLTINNSAGSSNILQYVTATSAVDDSTTSTSLVDSSLTASITPVSDNSRIEVRVFATAAVTYNSGGAVLQRSGIAAIYRSTGTPAALTNTLFGNNLVATSTVAATAYAPLHMAISEANTDLTTKTYVLQYSTNSTANISARILGSSYGPAYITLTEYQ